MNSSLKDNLGTTFLVANTITSRPSKIPKLAKWFTRSKREPKSTASHNESSCKKHSKLTNSRLSEKLSTKTDTKTAVQKPENDNSKKLSRWRKIKGSKIPVRVDPSKDVIKTKRQIKNIVTANRSTISVERKETNDDSFDIFLKDIEKESSQDLGTNWLAKLFSFGNDDSMSSEESHKEEDTVIEPDPSKQISSTTDETQTSQTNQKKYKFPNWFKKYKLKKSTTSNKSIIPSKSKIKKFIKQNPIKENVSKAKANNKKILKKKTKIKKDNNVSDIKETKIKKQIKPIPVQQSVSGDLISDIISMINRNKLDTSGQKASSKYGITKRMRPFSKNSQQASVVDMKRTLRNKWSKLKALDKEEEPRKKSLIQIIKKTGSDRRLVKELISQIENDTEVKRNLEFIDIKPNLTTNSLSNDMGSEESLVLISNPNQDNESADSTVSEITEEKYKRNSVDPNVSYEQPDKKQLLRVIKTIIDEEDYDEKDAEAERQKKINEDLIRLAKMVQKKSERNVKESDVSVEISSKYYETPTTSAPEDYDNDGRTITINANTKSHLNSNPTHTDNAIQLNKVVKLRRMLNNAKNTGDMPYSGSHTSVISQRLSETYIAGPASYKTKDTCSIDTETDSYEYEKVQKTLLPRRSITRKFQPTRDDSDADSILSRDLLQRRPSDSSMTGVRHRRSRLESKLAVIAEEPPCRSPCRSDAIRSTSQRRRRRPGVKLVKGNSFPHKPIVKKVKKADDVDSRYDGRIVKREKKFSSEDMNYDDRDTRQESTRFRPRRDDNPPGPPPRQESRPPRPEPRSTSQAKPETRRDMNSPREREAVRESKRDRPPKPPTKREEISPRTDSRRYEDHVKDKRKPDLKADAKENNSPRTDSRRNEDHVKDKRKPDLKADVKENRRNSKELKRDTVKEPATRHNYKESRHDEAEPTYDPDPVRKATK
ncbi:hypothetical protein JYU34_018130 [Plutella xylostella]|uniref:Uncharacterized protein n=1 Tax=Plutella xylostella TaxID=51655 RepID=A0ABQ7PZT3_PLUXY|nr:hypothetical protein JYU34_018130 [Plutella xylostella]